MQLNDDATTNDQFFPTLSTGSGGSVVIATWYDRRLDPANYLIDYYQRTPRMKTGARTTSRTSR